MIDMVRIPTYLSQFDRSFILSHIEVISLAIFLAFAGSFLGNRYLEKITLASLQKIVGISLMLIGAALILGII
ncbi:MAG: hypothetical protein KBD78_01940 [Oligoflexales bacterium]|nr:hypothetical protein [Oligoflexales bacterium]